MPFEAVLRRVKTGKRDEIAFHVPGNLRPALADQYRELPEYVRVKISRPAKGRTTGDFSQSHHINGHVQQIADYSGQDFDEVKGEAKRRAIKRGYPFDTVGPGWILPWSETLIDTVQAGFLIEELHQIAAELEIVLRED